MMTYEMVKENHEQYIRVSIPLFIDFIINNVVTYYEPTIWENKEEGKHRDNLGYYDIAWMFRFCKEHDYPIRIFKDSYNLLIGYEFIDELGKLNRYTMRLSEFKDMQEFNKHSLTMLDVQIQNDGYMKKILHNFSSHASKWYSISLVILISQYVIDAHSPGFGALGATTYSIVQNLVMSLCVGIFWLSIMRAVSEATRVRYVLDNKLLNELLKMATNKNSYTNH